MMAVSIISLKPQKNMQNFIPSLDSKPPLTWSQIKKCLLPKTRNKALTFLLHLLFSPQKAQSLITKTSQSSTITWVMLSTTSPIITETFGIDFVMRGRLSLTFKAWRSNRKVLRIRERRAMCLTFYWGRRKKAWNLSMLPLPIQVKVATLEGLSSWKQIILIIQA